MKYLYGDFTTYQIEDYKSKLHTDLFWLLLYKDPKTNKQYQNMDFEKYFLFLMKKIDGLNTLLSYPTNLVELCSLLQGAYNETQRSDYKYSSYRKMVLDAQALVDKIGG